MISEELHKFLSEEGYARLKEIPGQGVCGIFKFIFTYGLVIGIDSTGYRGRYCYNSFVEASMALELWDGQGDPPLNWIKYKGKGGERSNEK